VKLILACLPLALLVLSSCLPPADSFGPAATPISALASPTGGPASTAAPTTALAPLPTPTDLQAAYPPAPSLSQAYPPAGTGSGERSEPQAPAAAEAVQNFLAPVAGSARGYQTTPQELADIARQASQGQEPYRSGVAEVLAEAARPWDYKLDSEVRCPDAERPAWNDNDEGTPRLYGRALAYHLTGEVRYAQETSAILERIMTEVQSISLKQSQCRLNFSWGTPELVASADLLEEYWQARTCTGPASTVYGENELSQGPCKRLFQNWLVKNPYYLVSSSAEHSQNNWGAAATNTTAYIADYLWDRPEVKLVARTMSGEIALSPAAAYQRANQQALDRMNGYRVDEISSLSCDFLTGRGQNKDAPPVKSQISELGIIPDEARRDQACNIRAYNGVTRTTRSCTWAITSSSAS
jgi:hypothetical protein